MPSGNTSARFHQRLASCVLDVESGDVAAQPLRDQVHGEAILLYMEHVLVVEHVEDFLGGVVERAQDHRRRQFAAPVDAGVDQVLGIELEVEPRAPVGDHAGVVEDLAGGMRLALVVVEKDARRAMQLGDHHAFRAVDDEGAVVGHQWNLAHVDVLLLDVFDRFVGRLLVVEDQSHANAQGHRVGEAAQHAFADVERRLAELVVHILQGSVAGIAGNRKHRQESCVQALILQSAGPYAELQELRVGIHLNGEQVGDLHGIRQLAKVLADAFFSVKL